jgi:dynein heavy chain
VADFVQQRYYYYITNGIDTQRVADMNDSWLDNVLELLPKELKSKHHSLALLATEMRDDYTLSVKKAIGTAICCKSMAKSRSRFRLEGSA